MFKNPVFDTLFWFVVACIAFLASLKMQSYLNGSNNAKNVVASDTTITKNIDVVFDSIAHGLSNKNLTASKTDTFYFPPEYIYKTIATKIDTQAILKAFFSCRLSTSDYRDSNIFISVKDSMCMFQLLDRQITYKILRPDSIIIIEKTITNTIAEKPKTSFSIGGIANTKDLFSPGIMIQRNKFSFIANYGVTQGLGIGMFYKIR